MILVTYPPAARGRSLLAPKAIGRLSAAVMEARAAGSRGAVPVRPAQPPAQLHVLPPERRRTVVRLWLPSTLLFLLLAPFALLLALILSPLSLFAPRVFAFRPIVSALVLGRVLMSTSGTDVDVETPDALVRIRLF
jgi:hypothetical protein